MAVSHAIMTPLYYLWRNRKSWQIMSILLTVPRTTSTDLSICWESLIRMKETWHECKYYCQKSSWMGASCRKHEQFFLPWITWFSLCWKHDSLSKFVAKIAVQHSFMGKKKETTSISLKFDCTTVTLKSSEIMCSIFSLEEIKKTGDKSNGPF